MRGAPVGKSFLILGLDILIDTDLKAWLLEVNDNPSLYIYLEKDYMGGGVEKEISRVDLDVKSEVVADAIELAKKNAFPEQFKSYKRLLGMDDNGVSPVHDNLMKLLSLFESLTQIKNRKHLGISGFTKLAMRPYFAGSQVITKHELTTLFQRHVN